MNHQRPFTFAEALQIVATAILSAAAVLGLMVGLIWGIETVRARVWANETNRAGCICPPNAP